MTSKSEQMIIAKWKAQGVASFECEWCRTEKSLGWAAYWGTDCPECPDRRMEPKKQ